MIETRVGLNEGCGHADDTDEAADSGADFPSFNS